MAFITITPVARNGFANTVTRNINPTQILETRDANANEILSFPTALSAVVVNYTQYSQPMTMTLLTATATATLNAAIAAATSGVLGAGASGDATLVAGTVNVAIAGLTTTSKVLLTRHAAGGTVTSTVQYFYVVSAGQLTITAAVAAGTINTADTSVITFAIVG